jgi:hypothetical protein
MSEPQYLSRDIDYLGDIGAKLRDLRGYATLAHELIQNADDAPEATTISFDVRYDALIVDNDGFFSDCGNVRNADCRWKDERKHLCDFHRFRRVASGDKREETDATGAFGTGFISVYQITDQPELISSGQHWIIREDQESSKRIQVCPGCDHCRAPNLPRTRFILPWACNPDSVLRLAFRIEAISDQDANTFLGELTQSVPTAILFLKKIRQINILRDGQLVQRVERHSEKDNLIIQVSGREPERWRLLHGEFDDVAFDLRAQHGRRIEEKRGSAVTIAIPDTPLDRGLLCASLPTQYDTGLPFHVNADFFPSSDRKRIVFESEFQSQWNRAAIYAAAKTLRDNLDGLRTLVGHKRLWELIEATNHVASESSRGQCDNSLGEFWRLLASRLSQLPIVLTTKQTWNKPSETLLLENPDEEAAIPLLESLAIPIVHSDLRPYHNLLRNSQVGVQLLDVSHITARLQERGLNKRVPLSAVPSFLRERIQREMLWHEFEILLKRQRKPDAQRDVEQKIAACALVLGRDNALWQCKEVYHADEETRTLFASIAPSFPFVAGEEEGNNLLKLLCPVFTAATGASVLSRLGELALAQALAEHRLDPFQLIGWFESRRNDVLKSSQLRSQIAQLPIFPSANDLHDLNALALPGDFEDPLGLANLVDLKRLQGRRDFLRELGARELNFQRYAVEYIPRAITDSNVPKEKKQKAIRLLAERLSEIKGDPTTQNTLSEIPLVECEDGVFRKPSQVYLPSKNAADILGAVSVAALPRESPDAVRDLYVWLGVADKPRLQDIVARIQQLSDRPPTPQSVQAIRNIFEHLGECLKKDGENSSLLTPLRARAWLLARGDTKQWHKPQDLHAVFNDYLFATQARFLDVPYEIQRASSELLDVLAIRKAPQPDQVVAHLLECARKGIAVNRDVYRFLNDNAQDLSIDQLKDQACILLSNDTYVKPNQVFWGQHTFGRFRYQLGNDLRQYIKLFERLGVRQVPNTTDAMAVLTEIAQEYGESNRNLDDDAHAVLYECWKMLERTLDLGEISESEFASLRQLKIIPDKRRIMNKPEDVFFEDRAGLALKFDNFLEHNVITRPLGAWHAMKIAGVCSLARAVQSDLVECTEIQGGSLVQHRLQERREQLARVLESKELVQLDKIDFQAASELMVQYRIRAFNQERTSNPEGKSAHFRRDNKTLYYVTSNGTIPWAYIARELASEICTDDEPGHLALGIKEVLANETEQDARTTLDALGFPPFEIVDTTPVGAGNIIEQLGGQGAPPEIVGSSGQPTTPESPLTPEEPLRPILGGVQPPPPGFVPPQGPGDAPFTGKKQHTVGKQHGRFRTYVFEDEHQGEQDPDLAERHSKLGRIGEERVIEFEHQHGRLAGKMPINHKGYDIESKDAKGNIVRYIEVKAIGTGWGSSGVGLSDAQFHKALELGDKFWLYVVEHAERDDCRIYPIQNPARKANQFFYDDGWKQASEE